MKRCDTTNFVVGALVSRRPETWKYAVPTPFLMYNLYLEIATVCRETGNTNCCNTRSFSWRRFGNSINCGFLVRKARATKAISQP